MVTKRQLFAAFCSRARQTPVDLSFPQRRRVTGCRVVRSSNQQTIMRAFKQFNESYGSVQVATGVATANNVQLIQMLFDGLLESLDVAYGHIQNKAIAEKSNALVRAGRIVVGLQSALDFERGGEIAHNLNDLYAYVTRRLFHVNAHNDLEALDEVRGLIKDVSSAWENLPSLLGPLGVSGGVLPSKH
jgi:flagellar protein FliS